MTKFTFTGLYKATEEAIKLAKLPFVKNKNERAVNSAIDSAQLQGMDAQEELEKVLSVVADGGTIDVNKVLSLRATIANSEETVKQLTEFKAEFFAE